MSKFGKIWFKVETLVFYCPNFGLVMSKLVNILIFNARIGQNYDFFSKFGFEINTLVFLGQNKSKFCFLMSEFGFKVKTLV